MSAVKNNWQITRTHLNAVFECWIEDRVKDLFIEKFDLEIEFMQAETKPDIEGRTYYKLNVDDEAKIAEIKTFCRQIIITSNINPN